MLRLMMFLSSVVCLFVFFSPLLYVLWRMGRYARRIAITALLAVAVSLLRFCLSPGDIPQPMTWRTTAMQTESSGTIVDACDLCQGTFNHHAHCPIRPNVPGDLPCALCGNPEHPAELCPTLEYVAETDDSTHCQTPEYLAEMDDSDEEPLHEENRLNRGYGLFDYLSWDDL